MGLWVRRTCCVVLGRQIERENEFVYVRVCEDGGGGGLGFMMKTTSPNDESR